MENFPSINELKEISRNNSIELLEGVFENKINDSSNKFTIYQKLSFKDLFELVSNLAVKIIYVKSTSKYDYITRSFVEVVGENFWEDEIEESMNEDDDNSDSDDKLNLQIISINKKISEIIKKYLEREEDEDSKKVVIYSLYFYYNGIIHYYSLLNDELILKVDEQIMKDIQRIEDLISKRDELDIEMSESEENSKKHRKKEIAEELINDPIFNKLKNNRMRLNYIGEKYDVSHFQLQSILDEVQLLSIKRRTL